MQDLELRADIAVLSACRSAGGTGFGEGTAGCAKICGLLAQKNPTSNTASTTARIGMRKKIARLITTSASPR